MNQNLITSSNNQDKFNKHRNKYKNKKKNYSNHKYSNPKQENFFK